MSGGDLFRMKGVLVVKGAANRLVFQGVHMLFDAKLDRPWGADARMTTPVSYTHLTLPTTHSV